MTQGAKYQIIRRRIKEYNYDELFHNSDIDRLARFSAMTERAAVDLMELCVVFYMRGQEAGRKENTI